MNRKINKKAFTLAEVLITLAVIGVVAAMGIPAISNAIKNQETVTGVKKAYVTLSTAFKTMKVNDVILNGDGLDYDKIILFFNVSKSCAAHGTAWAGCFPSAKYKRRDRVTDWTDMNSHTRNAILADGMLLAFNIYPGYCTATAGTGPLVNSVCGDITVDINGFQGPNALGWDTFIFYFTKDDIYPAGSFYNGDFNVECGSSTNDNGSSCAGRILQENAVNY